MSNAFIDDNSRQTLTAVSVIDGRTIVDLYADPVTHRLLVDFATPPSFTVYTETPSGLVNGSNVTYTVSHSITSVLTFNINGQFIHPFNEDPEATVNYSVSGSTITFTSPLPVDLSGKPYTIVYI